jgi:glycosyltransferase involved in cell wall biosynthesis
MNNHFKIIIPLYNVEKWIKMCLRSIKAQTYKNFECIILDDLSTDGSVEVIRNEIKKDHRFKLVVNTEKAFALKNIYDGINLLNPAPEDIIVTLDGDDWFASKDVLKILNEEYNREGCWLTYGSYIEYPTKNRGKFAKKIPQQVIHSSTFRQHEWCSSHLRTFKYHLWSKIKKEDLLDTKGDFYRMTWDLAFMFPMLEMCGDKSHHIEKILYVYNVGNPLNDHKVDNSYQRQLEAEIRNKQKYKKIIPKIAGVDLLNANRFDIAAKTLFGENRFRKINTSFHRELYLEHLKVWNNFQEKTPSKNSPDDFVTSFDKTLNSINLNGFDENYKIPVISNSPINGAHRVASCIILNKEPQTYEADITEGQYRSDYQYFINKRDFVESGLKQEYLDEMALEFCRRKDDLYTITLFPSHEVSHSELLTKIKQGYNIIYHKEIELSKTGQKNYIHNLYHEESWLGSKQHGYPGVLEKAKLCFSRGDKITVILIREQDLKNLITLKDKLRKICAVGKHSVHINDTQEETWRIASSVFNHNSISFLNNRILHETPRFDNFFSQYRQALSNRKDKHDFCIDSSAVLSAYGLRDCRDLDFLHLRDLPPISFEIECHNNESHHYRVDKNDIIYDPRLHFYMYGVKFADLKVVRDMKMFRNEEKDKRDIESIKGVMA